MEIFFLITIALTSSCRGELSGEGSGYDNTPESSAYDYYDDYETDVTTNAFQNYSEGTQESYQNSGEGSGFDNTESSTYDEMEDTKPEGPKRTYMFGCAIAVPPEGRVEETYGQTGPEAYPSTPVFALCVNSNDSVNVNQTKHLNNTHSVNTETFSEFGKNTNKTLIRIVRLCGYPPYNNGSACYEQNYFSDPLSKCEAGWSKVLFGVIIGIAAIAIICANCLIISAIARNNEMRTHINYIKVSLAIADAIIGVLVLATVIPNMVWIRNLSEEEVLKFTRRDSNSPTAIVVGSILTATLQTSLLHLCFLSVERFMTINWTFWRLRRRTKSVLLTLVGIWVISIIAAFVPAVFPAHFDYRFQPVLLIHMLNIRAKKSAANGLGYEGIAYVSVAFLLPYIVTVIMCIMTAVATYQKLRSSTRRLFGKASNGSTEATNYRADTKTKIAMRKRLALEFSVYVTVLIMLAAFTCTLVPFFSVVVMFVFGKLNCSNYTVPYTVSFYFHILNSLTNVVIYMLRNPKFRSGVKQQFCKRDLVKSSM